MISTENIITIVLSIIGGGGVGWAVAKNIVRVEARAELKDDIESLHQRANNIENNYVTCKYCNMQHDNLGKTLNSMDKKLDILIEKK